MASSVTFNGLHGYLLGSQFLGQYHHPLKRPSTVIHRKPTLELQPRAKFNFLEMMGGRGICNGELGVQQELERQVDDQSPSPQEAAAAAAAATTISGEEQENSVGSVAVSEDAFEKEMMGLTGGFPGGEKGLKKFIEENPPPKQGTVLI